MNKNPFAERKYGRMLADRYTGMPHCAFEGYYVDSSVEEVEVPAVIDGIPVTELVGRAFQHKKLKTVILPDCITEIRDAFCDVATLEYVNIPASTTRIGPDAFRNCTALMELRIPATVTEIEDRNGHLPFIGCGGARKTGKYRNEMVKGLPYRVPACGSDSEMRYRYGDDVEIHGDYAVVSGRMEKISVPEYDRPYGDLTLIVDSGSCAEEYARRMGIRYRYPD